MSPAGAGTTRRRLLGVSLLGPLAAACGANEEIEAVPLTGTSEGKVVYAGWGSPQRRESETWSLLRFEKNYADLKVDLIWSPTAAEHVTRQVSMLSSGAPPDVLRLPSWSAPTFYNEDAVQRLDPLIKRDGFKTEHLAQPYDVATFKRGWYALPRGSTGAWVVFYNRRLFSQAGLKAPANAWTWDDFLAAARELTRSGGQWGTALEPLADFYYPWLWGNGGEDIERTGERSLLDQAEARDALQWLADLRLKHKVAPPPGELPGGPEGFAAGRLGMWFGRADAELDLARLPAIDYGIAPQPRGKHGQQAGYKPDVVALSANSQHPNDAWEFLQFLVDVDTQRVEFENGLWLPQAKAIVETEAYQKPAGAPHDRRPGIPGAVLRARSPVTLPRGDEMRAASQRELAPFWQGGRSVQQATEAAAKAVNAILHGEA